VISTVSHSPADSYLISPRVSVTGPGSMLIYLLASGMLLTRLRRPIGKFTVNEQRLEGEFRFVNSRLITHSEEVAFYGGNEKERAVINQSFRGLINHLRHSIQFRALLGIIDSIIAKYCASSVGYLVVSRPFFDLNNAKYRNASQAELMEDYYKSGRMLMNMALAVGRLVLAGRELTRLAGYTARVTELQAVLKDLNAGIYQRTMVNKGVSTTARELKPNSGRIITQDHIIKFEACPSSAYRFLKRGGL